MTNGHTVIINGISLLMQGSAELHKSPDEYRQGFGTGLTIVKPVVSKFSCQIEVCFD